MVTRTRQRLFEYGFWLLVLPAGWAIVLWNKVQSWQRFNATIDFSRLWIEEITSCAAALVMVAFVAWWTRLFSPGKPWWRFGAGHTFGAFLFSLGHFAIYIVLRIAAYAVFEDRAYQWRGGLLGNFTFELQKDIPIYIAIVASMLIYARFIRPALADEANTPRAHAAPALDDRVIVMTGRGEAVLPIKEVLYLAAARNYVSYFTADGEFVVRDTLSSLAERLSSHGFERTHRSFVVNLAQVREIIGDEIVLSDGRKVPLGRRFKNAFRARLTSA